MNDAGSILLRTTTNTFSRSPNNCVPAACLRVRQQSPGGGGTGRAIDVLVADANMEGNTDLELVLHAQQAARGMPVVLVADHPCGNATRPSICRSWLT